MNYRVATRIRIWLLVAILLPMAGIAQQGAHLPSLDSTLSLTYMNQQSAERTEAALLRTTDRGSRLMLLLTRSKLAQARRDTLTIARTYPEAIHLVTSFGGDQELGFLELQKATLHFHRHHLPEALISLHLADSLAKRAEDRALRSEIHARISEVFRLGSELEKALQAAIDAEEFGKGIPSLVMQARVKHISINHQLHAHDKDTNYLATQAQLIASLSNVSSPTLAASDAAQLQCELGSLEKERRHKDRAYAAFERAAAQYRSIGDFPNYCSVQASIYELVRDTRPPAEAIKFGKASLDSCVKYDFHDRDHEFYHGIMKAYTALGKYKEALVYSRLNFEERMRLEGEYSRKRLQELENRYEVAKREEELGRISSERNLLQLENDTSRLWLRGLLVGGTIVLVLLAAVAVLAIRSIRANARIKQQAQDLRDQNQMINRNLEEKEFLFRELHHRVKNNLQLLTSFLSLQISHHPKQLPEDFLGAVEKKIKAMSLVHEQLSRTSEVGRVVLKDYFQDICEHLLGSLGAVLPDLEIQIEGDDVQVNVDKAIQLGLILNEMVTNSLKHAYPDGDQEAVITVDIRETATGDASITICDNGVGFPTQFDPFGSNRVGTRIIVLLVRQLGASLEFFNQSGATWRLQLPVSK